MQPYVIILAATTQEAATYARLTNLPRGRFRYAVNAHAIRGLVRSQIHELPSFKVARNRHAIEAELRWGRHERLQVEMPGRAPVDQGDGMGEQLSIDDLEPVAYDGQGAPLYEHQVEDPRGPLTDAVLEDAYDIHRIEALLEPVGWEPPATLDATQVLRLAAGESGADVAPTLDPVLGGVTDDMGDPIAPAKKRRSRCKVCGELVFAADDPRHDGAKHDASQVTDRPTPTLVAQDMASTSLFGGL